MLVDRLIAAAQGSSCAVIYIRFMRYAFRNKSEMNNCPPFHLTPHPPRPYAMPHINQATAT